MLKIYSTREQEKRLLPLLAEFKARVITSFPIKGVTRKIQGKNAYKVVSFPLERASEIEQEIADSTAGMHEPKWCYCECEMAIPHIH